MTNTFDIDILRQDRDKELDENARLMKELHALQSKHGESALNGLRSLSVINEEFQKVKERIDEIESFSFDLNDLKKISDYIRICELFNRL